MWKRHFSILREQQDVGTRYIPGPYLVVRIDDNELVGIFDEEYQAEAHAEELYEIMREDAERILLGAKDEQDSD